MQSSLAATALLMGLAGGPHCAAMCGAACAGVGRSRNGRNTRAMWSFQAGRLAGYSALGGLAAASIQSLGWLSLQAAVLRPVWMLFHVAAALLGLVLLWQARQPVWLESAGRRVWGGVRAALGDAGATAPLLLGVLWSLLPCGLLYAALLVAAISSSPLDGAVVMALFALGSGLSLMAGPWLLLRLGRPGSGQWAIRLAGLALLLASLWALGMGLAQDLAPWCSTP